MWGGKVLIISTHNGVDNPFNLLIEDIKAGQKPYAPVRVTLDDALSDGLYRLICLVQGKVWSEAAEAAWRADIIAQYGEAADEELFCIASQAAGCWIAPELIAAATHKDAGKRALFGKGSAFIGNDIARRCDGWVSTVERVGDVLWLCDERLLHGQSFAIQDAVLDEQVAFFKPMRVVMDQTGRGEKSVEDAKRRDGELRVEGVLMAGDRPLNVATAARRAFEERLVRITDDPALRSEIHLIKKITGPTGEPRLLTGRDKASHADRAWALFLAITAASNGAVTSAGASIAAPADHRSAGDGHGRLIVGRRTRVFGA